ncbi:hypothetical protein HKD37_03G007160 [Glycine soja]
MAEHGTRCTTTDRLEEAIFVLFKKHSELANKVDAMCERFSHMASAHPPQSQLPIPSCPLVKLDVPRFNGHDPLRWIFKISQFFDYQGTSEEDR